MITEKELDELYFQQEEKRRMYKARIDLERIRERVRDILKKITYTNSGDLVEYFIIITDGKSTGKWSHRFEKKNVVLIRQFQKVSLQEEEYFERLLLKYFNIEKISKNKLKLTLRF